MDEPTTATPATTEPTITVPLRSFLEILWGYKHKERDFRDKAYPSDEIIKALESLPKEVAARYFIIQHPRPSVGMVDTAVWSKQDWQTSGYQEELAKIESAKFNYASDKLGEYLIAKFPIMDKAFLKSLALQIINQKNYFVLITLGCSEAEIEQIKTGTY